MSILTVIETDIELCECKVVIFALRMTEIVRGK